MDIHTLYSSALCALFVFWNGVRIFTYVPTILKLLRPEAEARDYSLTTWGSWVCSNGFFALYLWEQSHRQLNAMVLLNTGNTLMCAITCCCIFRLQHRTARQPDSNHVPAVRTLHRV
ncbi:MAG TPA: hypothetical protein VFQ61_20860 [Polyangiaceae bacterium]|nr:hypothetical protein [Polyangiaceae bacterium]